MNRKLLKMPTRRNGTIVLMRNVASTAKEAEYPSKSTMCATNIDRGVVKLGRRGFVTHLGATPAAAAVFQGPSKIVVTGSEYSQGSAALKKIVAAMSSMVTTK
jgi:hypothetical protein